MYPKNSDDMKKRIDNSIHDLSPSSDSSFRDKTETDDKEGAFNFRSVKKVNPIKNNELSSHQTVLKDISERKVTATGSQIKEYYIERGQGGQVRVHNEDADGAKSLVRKQNVSSASSSSNDFYATGSQIKEYYIERGQGGQVRVHNEDADGAKSLVRKQNVSSASSSSNDFYATGSQIKEYHIERGQGQARVHQETDADGTESLVRKQNVSSGSSNSNDFYHNHNHKLVAGNRVNNQFEKSSARKNVSDELPELGIMVVDEHGQFIDLGRAKDQQIDGYEVSRKSQLKSKRDNTKASELESKYMSRNRNAGKQLSRRGASGRFEGVSERKNATDNIPEYGLLLNDKQGQLIDIGRSRTKATDSFELSRRRQLKEKADNATSSISESEYSLGFQNKVKHAKMTNRSDDERNNAKTSVPELRFSDYYSHNTKISGESRDLGAKKSEIVITPLTNLAFDKIRKSKGSNEELRPLCELLDMNNEYFKEKELNEFLTRMIMLFRNDTNLVELRDLSITNEMLSKRVNVEKIKEVINRYGVNVEFKNGGTAFARVKDFFRRKKNQICPLESHKFIVNTTFLLRCVETRNK